LIDLKSWKSIAQILLTKKKIKMKRLSFLSIVLLMIVALSTNAADIRGNLISLNGNSNTYLGNYQIKELEPVNNNGQMMRTFEMKYDNAEKPVMVYIDEQSKCRDYIVRCKNLEIKYVCKKTSFGASLVDVKHAKYDPLLNARFLSEENFENQKKLSEGSLPIPSALELIASYFPDLLKRRDLLN
jgi:hypothetical protein